MPPPLGLSEANSEAPPPPGLSEEEGIDWSGDAEEADFSADLALVSSLLTPLNWAPSDTKEIFTHVAYARGFGLSECLRLRGFANLNLLLELSVLHDAPPEFVRWIRLRMAEHLSGQTFDAHRLTFCFKQLEEGACQLLSSRGPIPPASAWAHFFFSCGHSLLRRNVPSVSSPSHGSDRAVRRRLGPAGDA